MRRDNYRDDYKLSREEVAMAERGLEREDDYDLHFPKRLVITPSPKTFVENLKELGIEYEEWEFGYYADSTNENMTAMSAVIFEAEDAIYRTILRANRECKLYEAMQNG